MCIKWNNAQKVDVRVELTKKTSHCKSRDFLRKRRLKRTAEVRFEPRLPTWNHFFNFRIGLKKFFTKVEDSG